MSQAISTSPIFVHLEQDVSSSSSSHPQIEGRAVSLIATQEEDELECSICLENSLSEEPTPRRKLKCGHEFHARCINSWIALKSNCPLCREKIPYSRRQTTIAFAILTGLCVGSAYIMINHLDSPMRGLFKTTCFALSYLCAHTAAEEVISNRSDSSTKELVTWSGAFAAACALT